VDVKLVAALWNIALSPLAKVFIEAIAVSPIRKIRRPYSTRS
jgi:hypothetical protein